MYSIMKAIIPAAGYATRLHPLTIDKPKALLEIRGRPVINYIIEKIVQIDEINEIIIVTNNKFYDKFLKWNEKFNKKLPLTILNDETNTNEERLGTMGDIYFAIKQNLVNDDILIINSDNLFSFNLIKSYNNFKIKNNTLIGLYDVREKDIARKFGNVKLGKRNKIIFFKEKDPNPASTLCSIGIYFFPKEITYLIKSYLEEGNSPDRSGDFIEWLYRKEEVYGYLFDNKERWIDIGSVQEYNKAQRLFI